MKNILALVALTVWMSAATATNVATKKNTTTLPKATTVGAVPTKGTKNTAQNALVGVIVANSEPVPLPPSGGTGLPKCEPGLISGESNGVVVCVDPGTGDGGDWYERGGGGGGGGSGEMSESERRIEQKIQDCKDKAARDLADARTLWEARIDVCLAPGTTDFGVLVDTIKRLLGIVVVTPEQCVTHRTTLYEADKLSIELALDRCKGNARSGG